MCILSTPDNRDRFPISPQYRSPACGALESGCRFARASCSSSTAFPAPPFPFRAQSDPAARPNPTRLHPSRPVPPSNSNPRARPTDPPPSSTSPSAPRYPDAPSPHTNPASSPHAQKSLTAPSHPTPPPTNSSPLSPASPKTAHPHSQSSKAPSPTHGPT